jgi:predicted RNase H-like nuclease (RuvC/YqgF family)
MSRQISIEEIKIIVRLIDGWIGKLTWDILIDRITIKLGFSFTRQALDRHEEIKSAFQIRKDALRKGSKRAAIKVSPEAQIYVQQIERLKAENERLSRENNNLKARFAQWSTNAYNVGKTEAMLNQHGEKISILDKPLVRSKSDQ